MHWLYPYGSESWTLKNKDTNKLTEVEKEFFRKTAEYNIFDQKRNEERLKDLKVEAAEN
jgi:hypothetical protein